MRQISTFALLCDRRKIAPAVISSDRFEDRPNMVRMQSYAAILAEITILGGNMTIIEEVECDCQACGNRWYISALDKSEESTQQDREDVRCFLCCTGCFPALLIPDKNIDLGKCPKCGSRAIKKKAIKHEV